MALSLKSLFPLLRIWEFLKCGHPKNIRGYVEIVGFLMFVYTILRCDVCIYHFEMLASIEGTTTQFGL